MIILLRVVAVCLSIAVASSAFGIAFLWTLSEVTNFRSKYLSVVWLLPVAGVLLGYVSTRWAGGTKFGANLVVARARGDLDDLPSIVAPYAMITTGIAHLFGASVGREGTALQIGGGLANEITKRVNLSNSWKTTLVTVGAAAGFSSVFGAPIAGAVFACEVQRRFGGHWKPLVWTLPTSFLADALTRCSGVAHTAFPTVEWHEPTLAIVVGLSVLGLAIGLVGNLFLFALGWVQAQLEQLVPDLRARLALGGVATLILWVVCGSSNYLGLGTSTIEHAMIAPMDDDWAFAWKFIFTLAAVGFGFPGGEVTPLFFMGATLGNTLSPALGLPLELASGVALFAMFGGPAGTPIAMAIMAAECLGVATLPYALFVCTIVFATQRKTTLYPAQLESTAKGRKAVTEDKVDSP